MEDKKDEDIKTGQEPEKEPGSKPSPQDDGRKDGQRKEKKDNVYDQYRYWGSGGKDDGGKLKMNGRNRFTLFIFLALIISFAFLFLNQGGGNRPAEVAWSSFSDALDSGSVTQVDIQDETTVTVLTSEGF